MPALWTYPWDLADEGVDDAVVDTAEREIDMLAPATHTDLLHGVTAADSSHWI